MRIFICLNTAKDMYLAAQINNTLSKNNLKYELDYYDFNLEVNWAAGPAHYNFFHILTNHKNNVCLTSNTHLNNSEYLFKCLKVAKQLEYDVYCFSFWDSYVDIQLLMALEIKKHNPRAKILFGGPDIILRPYLGEILKKIGFDYSTGDIDVSLHEYITDYSGFYDKKHTQKMNMLASNDVPKYTKEELDYLNHAIMISTSRGCANSCRFCSSPALSNFSYVPRNALVDWFSYYNDIGVKEVNPNDSTFNKAEFDILLNGLINIDNKIIISRADVSFVDLRKDQIAKMAQAQFKEVCIGFECLHPIMQKNINKKMPPVDEILLYLEEFQKYEISVKLFYIAGIPSQTDEIFYDELEVIKYVDENFSNVYFEFYDYFISPMSYIDKHPEKFNIRKETKFNNFISKLPEFKNEILKFQNGIKANPDDQKIDLYMKKLYSAVNKTVNMDNSSLYVN